MVYLNVGGDGNGFVLVVLSRVGKAGDGCANEDFNFTDDRMKRSGGVDGVIFCYIGGVIFAMF